MCDVTIQYVHQSNKLLTFSQLPAWYSASQNCAVIITVLQDIFYHCQKTQNSYTAALTSCLWQCTFKWHDKHIVIHTRTYWLTFMPLETLSYSAFQFSSVQLQAASRCVCQSSARWNLWITPKMGVRAVGAGCSPWVLWVGQNNFWSNCQIFQRTASS